MSTEIVNKGELLSKAYVQDFDDLPRLVMGRLANLAIDTLEAYFSDLFHDYDALNRIFAEENSESAQNAFKYGITFMFRQTGTWLKENDADDPIGLKYVNFMNESSLNEAVTVTFHPRSYGGWAVKFHKFEI